MKVTKISTLSAEQLFQTMLNSLIEDYQSATQKSLGKSAIKPGLTYVKTFGNKGQHSVKICLEELISNQTYAILYSSNRGKQRVSYQLTSLSSGETQIAYEEMAIAATFSQKANQYLINFLFKKSLKRRMEAQLNALIRAAQ